MGEEAFYNQAITTGDAAMIRLFLKAAIKEQMWDLRKLLIQAYDSVHSRTSKKELAEEEFTITQAMINQGFVDLVCMPVSTLVNTAGDYNVSNCFQALATSTGFNNDMLEIGGRIHFYSPSTRTLASNSWLGNTVAGSTKVSAIDLTIHRGGFPSTPLNAGAFVSGPGIAAGTIVGQRDVINFGAPLPISFKRNLNTRDHTVVKMNPDGTYLPTTIAAMSAENDAQTGSYAATLTALAPVTGDLVSGNIGGGAINTVTDESRIVSNVSNMTGIVVGMMVQGPYLPLGTTVSAIGPSATLLANQIQLSQGAVNNSDRNTQVQDKYTGVTLLFGLCAGVAVQAYSGGIVAGSPYMVINTPAALASTIDGTSAVILMADTTGIQVGMKVSGVDIPAGSLVLSIVTNTSITISQNTTGGIAATPSLAFSLNICRMMTLTGTGVGAAALVYDLSVSGSSTILTLSANSTATNLMPMSMDLGYGPGVDQGSGIYRTQSFGAGYCTALSTSVTGLVTTYIPVGATVTGTGIPALTTVTAVTPSTIVSGVVQRDGSITLSAAATAPTLASMTTVNGVVLRTATLLTFSGAAVAALLPQSYRTWGQGVAGGFPICTVDSSLSKGESTASNFAAKLRSNEELPAPTLAQMRNRLEGVIWGRADNTGNTHSFMWPSIWPGVIVFGEALECAMGPVNAPKQLLMMNPHNDIASGPIPFHYQQGTGGNTYYLQQFKGLSGGVATLSGNYDTQFFRDLFYPKF